MSVRNEFPLNTLKQDILNLIRQETTPLSLLSLKKKLPLLSLKKMAACSALCTFQGREAAIEKLPIPPSLQKFLHETLVEGRCYDAFRDFPHEILRLDAFEALRARNWHTLPFTSREEARVAAYFCWRTNENPQQHWDKIYQRAFYYYTRADDPKKQVIKVAAYPFVKPVYTVSQSPYGIKDLHESFLFHVQGIAFTMQLSHLYENKVIPDEAPFDGHPVYYPDCYLYCYKLDKTAPQSCEKNEVYLENPLFHVESPEGELFISAKIQSQGRTLKKKFSVPELYQVEDGQEPTLSSSFPDIQMKCNLVAIQNIFSQGDTDGLLSIQSPGGAKGLQIKAVNKATPLPSGIKDLRI